MPIFHKNTYLRRAQSKVNFADLVPKIENDLNSLALWIWLKLGYVKQFRPSSILSVSWERGAGRITPYTPVFIIHPFCFELTRRFFFSFECFLNYHFSMTVLVKLSSTSDLILLTTYVTTTATISITIDYDDD